MKTSLKSIQFYIKIYQKYTNNNNNSNECWKGKKIIKPVRLTKILQLQPSANRI